MLKDFFEGNSVSLEIFDMYDLYREEKSAKASLKQVYREIMEEYSGEIDMQTIGLMSIYYCGLLHGVCDEPLKEKLAVISLDFVNDAFGIEQGPLIFDILKELLTLEPTKPKKVKKPYNIGARKWKVGDVFAYSLTHLRDTEPDFQNLYALIHCTDIEVVSNRTMEVKIYVRLCQEEIIHEPIEVLFEKSFYLPSYMIRHFYKRKLISPHSDYPTEKLLYLGNITEYQLPEDEHSFPNEYHCPLAIWESFDKDIIRQYQFFKRHS